MPQDGYSMTPTPLLIPQIRIHFPAQPVKSQVSGLKVGDEFTINGFLSRRRTSHQNLVFANVTSDYVPEVQIAAAVSETDGSESPAVLALKELKSIPLHSPVTVTGRVTSLERTSNPTGRTVRVDMDLQSIRPLNPFPKDIIVSKGVKFPPSARHLQLRFSEALRHRLLFRADVKRLCQGLLKAQGFADFETPMLFKSTPEGAREFLVPTRRKGSAYALPQSPQQYKQLLMASGFHRYFQFARCFRDEDLRADRQPEFTQLDLEMAFATGEDVMRTVEVTLRALLARLFTDRYEMKEIGDERVPVLPPLKADLEKPHHKGDHFTQEPREDPWRRITYQEAMDKYGSDKPDLRIPFDIQHIDTSLLPASFISMITHLEQPIIEALHFRPSSPSPTPQSTRAFITKLMDSLPTSLISNPSGAPAVLLIDSTKPLQGLSSLGHEGHSALTSLPTFSSLEDGDVLILQARPNHPHQGGSTPLGNLRNLLYAEAVSQGLLPRNDSLEFLWVTDFPLFTPNDPNSTDPGQGGSAGFSATHHPFTAPLTDTDFDLLAIDPLRARADHYDLVLNGVELGGGSRRIHVKEVQEYVMRDILKMSDEGVGQFSHLLEALRAGCPPHAGFALGFDRFVAVLSGTGSVRDVIAFPKSMKGEDLMVRAPGKVTGEQLGVYHLEFKKKEGQSGGKKQEEKKE
ncbi:aspartyl-tRNA synthetase-like protein [Coniochaeta sp. 2T2.1]|nr:aspartyl-tRNA synthetase-like protein [Coniochaeta sp. 2T2.1]